MRKLTLIAVTTVLSLQSGSAKAASTDIALMAAQIDLAMTLAIPAAILIGFGIMLHAATSR